jgi:hypothetical protein
MISGRNARNIKHDSPDYVMAGKKLANQRADVLKYPAEIGQTVNKDDGMEKLLVWMEFRDSLLSHYEVAHGEERGSFEKVVNKTKSFVLGNTKSASKTNSAIQLYIPPVISINGEVSWGESEYGGSFGAAASNKSAGALGAAQAVIGEAEKLGKGVFLGQEGAAIDFQKKNNVIQNMNKQLMFQGTGMRTFEFEFEFIPKSLKEAKDITEIIKWFRSRMYPNYHGVWFTVPDTIMIEFKNATQSIKTLPRIKDSVITSCNITYGSEGVFGIMEGNTEYPYSTTMTLSLQETAIITSDDILNTVDGGY